MNYKKKYGFTLTELLMALAIVGVLAVMTVPSLMNNVFNKVYANQSKNMAATIEQLAHDELVAKRTRDLSNTDFDSPTNLLSDKHFSIAKYCASSDSLKNCWKTSSAATKQVKYKNLANSALTITAGESIILTNGVLLRYESEDNDGKTTGKFLVDVNGNDGPNIAGRDLFMFYVTPRGHIADIGSISTGDFTLEQKVQKCKENSSPEAWCFGALVDKAWKMDY